MTPSTLSSVTLQTIENYRTAAARAVVAYHLGGKRLLGWVNGTLQNSVYPRTSKLAPRTTERFNQIRGSASEVVVKGVEQVAQRTGQAIEFGSAAAASQVSKLARFAAGVDHERVAGGLQTAARLSLPGARIALALSSRIAQGANALADAAGARPVRGMARKAALQAQRRAAPVARKAQATLKSGAKRVAKFSKRATR